MVWAYFDVHTFWSLHIFMIPQVTNTESKLTQLNETMAKKGKSYQEEKKTFTDSLVCG